MTIRPAIADSTIIATFGWPYSTDDIVRGFRMIGIETTKTHIEQVWQKAKSAGDLPPLDRPEQGFDYRGCILVQALRAGR